MMPVSLRQHTRLRGETICRISTICRRSIILSFARVCRVGVCFGFVGSALLLAVGTCVVVSFEAMPGLCCYVTHAYVASMHGDIRPICPLGA